ncbi:MAG: sigma-70 family RNA polymerase sigma factor [Alphaproteobacteria bacterium]|nr:MAG: sigma-70 family RNA polymerase sigma factor [Alphaproteobacteria bacterium]
MTGADASAGPKLAENLADPQFVETLRKKMLQFATVQLGDAHLAEDAVQDALVGAFRNARDFEGRAAMKTWVFAILKNKIADMLRQRSRLVTAGAVFEEGEDDGASAMFDGRGHWLADQSPRAWSDPEAALQQRQFWQVFEACLDGLPANQARIFMMREFIGLETPEICAAAQISQSNLFVILHRARLRLRRCLEMKWFMGDRRC